MSTNPRTRHKTAQKREATPYHELLSTVRLEFEC